MSVDIINVIFELVNTLSRVNVTDDIHVEIKNNLIEHHYPVNNLNLYVYDNVANQLRDFNNSRNTVNRENNIDLYNLFENFKEYDISVNGKFFKLGSVPVNANIKLKDVAIPFFKSSDLYGMLIIDFDLDFEINTSFLTALKVLASQICLKIQNVILMEQMEINVDFHNSMKNIAKIIETQYELNYIIPIIGEMLDKFINLHLIYVFLKENDDYRLVWPKDCRDKQILSMLKDLKLKNEVILSNDGKRGVFALTKEEDVIGAVAAFGISEELTKKEISYLEQLSKQASITINRANSYAETLRFATLDALTGLNNRRQFESRLSQEISIAKRQKQPLCGMMIDIDFFKKINDTYGHSVGDIALQEIAKLIKKELRESDIPSRYGGEEFSVILPNTGIEEACLVAERLRNSVANNLVRIFNEKTNSSEDLKITISIGVAEYFLDSNIEKLFLDADKALYQAKKSGRNTVVKYEE